MADEPTGALDSNSSRVLLENILFGDGRDVLTIQQDMPGAYCINSGDAVLLEVMSNFNREMGATILMVTHDAFSASYGSRILFLKDGRIFNEILKGEKNRL